MHAGVKSLAMCCLGMMGVGLEMGYLPGGKYLDDRCTFLRSSVLWLCAQASVLESSGVCCGCTYRWLHLFQLGNWGNARARLRR